jgi:radical SAM superfamily enzyme YgiQ (UPF0313 family)
MSSRVLLINSNTYDQPYPVFPLGLAHVDTALRKAGHTTRLYDCQVETEPLETAIAQFAPDFIGISFRNVDDVQFVQQRTYFEAPIEIARRVRAATKCPVILGGSAFSLYPEKMLELTGANYGVCGEGEVAVMRLLRGDDRHDVPGLAYRENGRIVVNPRERMSAAEIAPAERRSELVDYYLRSSSMLSIQTQRGCPLACCYCTYPLIEGRAPRRRDPDVVAEELAAIERQGAKYVFITDSVFNTTAEHAAAVCEAILRRGVKLKWCCFLRPTDLGPELINLMARAGLSHIEFGTDSLCDSVLKEYGKSFTVAEVLAINERIHDAKIHQAHFIICGGPGETRETLRTTFENSRRLRGAVVFGLPGMRIYPGTALEARARREGVIDEHTDLLQPAYYISPALGEATLTAMMREAPTWIIGEMPAAMAELTQRLRQRGVVGPLWEYFATLQRMT